MFIGHGRSGSTLVGALLNAHPDAVISNELNIVQYLRYPRERLFNLIYRKAEDQAGFGQKGGGGYSYAVPGQWQGRYRRIKVIGDRKAGVTAQHLSERLELLDHIRHAIRLPLRFVSVVRNPFDTLTTIMRYSRRLSNETPTGHLEREVSLFFRRVETISVIAQTVPVTFVDHEVLIDDPKVALRALCEDFGLEPEQSYLDDCAAIVKKTSHRTRDRIEWPKALVKDVEQRSSSVGWMRNFTFD
jgi:hypothetical protein